MNNFIVENQTLIFILMGACVFALSTYLGILYTQLKRQKQEQEILQQKLEKKMAERHEFLKDSIITLSNAFINGQCELSEACLRVRKLLINYPDIEADEQFKPIFDMYSEIEDFPYLEARQKLSKQELFKQDNERFAIEEKYNAQMHKALNLLVKRFENLH